MLILVINNTILSVRNSTDNKNAVFPLNLSEETKEVFIAKHATYKIAWIHQSILKT